MATVLKMLAKVTMNFIFFPSPYGSGPIDKPKDPRFTRLKSGLALRLLSKGLFYIWAMSKGQSL